MPRQDRHQQKSDRNPDNRRDRDSGHNREIERNMAAFEKHLPALVHRYKWQYAVLRKQAIVGIYDTLHDAHLSADKLYADGVYSIQKITQTPENLGIFSNAGLHTQP